MGYFLRPLQRAFVHRQTCLYRLDGALFKKSNQMDTQKNVSSYPWAELHKRRKIRAATEGTERRDKSLAGKKD